MTEYIVGLRLGKRSDVLTIEAEDALIAALKVKHNHPEALISTFENPIGAATVVIRIGRNEDYEAHRRMSASGTKRTSNRRLPMSAFGTTRTSQLRSPMSAFGGKADII
jgi:hypothetical protein